MTKHRCNACGYVADNEFVRCPNCCGDVRRNDGFECVKMKNAKPYNVSCWITQRAMVFDVLARSEEEAQGIIEDRLSHDGLSAICKAYECDVDTEDYGVA